MHGFVVIWKFSLDSRFPANFRPPPVTPGEIEGIFVFLVPWASIWYIICLDWLRIEKSPNLEVRGIFGFSHTEPFYSCFWEISVDLSMFKII